MLKQTTELAPDGQPWNLLTLRNDAGMTVTVMDWGATLLSARVPWRTVANEKRCSAARPPATIRARPLTLALP